MRLANKGRHSPSYLHQAERGGAYATVSLRTLLQYALLLSVFLYHDSHKIEPLDVLIALLEYCE